MIFDSHAHYDDEQFDSDREALLTEVLPAKGVIGILNAASSFESIGQVIALTEKYPNLYGAAGIHPECAGSLPPDWAKAVESALEREKIVAVGEIGLDYHYEELCPREKQREVFETQLRIAQRKNVPVLIHDREAHGDTMELLQKYRPKGVVHCFSGSPEMARQLVKQGMYLGVGGVVTFKNARQIVETVRELPLERLLLETDCPYLAPVPLRGKRNDSSLIVYAAAKIAEIRGVTAEEVLESSLRSVRQLFGIS